MSALRLLDRAVFVALATLALAGAAGTVALLCHARVPGWILPAAFVAALLLPRRVPAAAPVRHRALAAGAAGLVLLLALALGYGALATPSRHWDGAVAWDAKAAALAAAPTLEQPYFRDPGVYCHSRDYPLLQPLLVALGDRALGGGRLLFPLAFLIATAAIALALCRRGLDGRVAALTALCFAVTPNLVNPTSGGFDSGYADGLLAMALTVAAAGVVAGDRAWLLLGALLMVLTKPEGLVYGGVLAAALWVTGSSRLLPAATAGWLVGAALQLPLQRDLQTFGESTALLPTLLLAAVIAAALLLGDRWLARRASPRRLWVALIGAPLLLLAAPLLLVLLDDRPGTFATYLSEPARALARVDRVPAVLLGAAEHAVGRGAFGLCWVLPPLLWWLSRRRPTDATTHALGVTCLLLAAVWALPFFLSPIEDVAHHLRSTLPRLLNHGAGAAWLLTALLWQRLAAPTTAGAASPAAASG